ncbi:hypothetical protein [Altibacter sp. HG106]|uniref:hypothetical protein n=1 Tax=Altibacter sp. HG106 TaxID=3023937 RepID=UPI002350225B|nr:hypothetical protein [Altibacter sp. HG106]MDC7995915.1 hypothetical protein [Altibacter sp. HG106]
MKRTVFGIILGVALLHLCACQLADSKDQPLYQYLPKDTSIIYEISDYDLFRTDWEQNALISQFPDNPLSVFLDEQESLLQHLKPTAKSYLGFKRQDSVAHYFYVTRNDSTLLVLDSVPNRMVEGITQAPLEYKKVTLGETIAYTAVRDSVFLASSSKEWLVAQLDSKATWDASVEKFFSLKETSELAILYNEPLRKNSKETGLLGGPGVWDVNLLSGGIETTGVVLVNDSIKPLLNLFKQQQPQTNLLPEILPLDAQEATSATYSDGSRLLRQLSFREKDSIVVEDPEGILSGTSELGSLVMASGKAWAFRGIDPARMMEVWTAFLNEDETFRDQQLYTLGRTPEFFGPLEPLLGALNPVYAFELEDFVVLTENRAVAEALIVAFQTNNTLSKTAYYEDHMNVMTSNASLVYYHWSNQAMESTANFFFKTPSATTSASSRYPFSMLQLIHEGSFAHANFACLPVGSSQQPPGQVVQRFSKTMDNDLLSLPTFFSNHRTSGQDVVVQDIQNRVHLLSAEGNLLWSKSLKEPLIGRFHEIDLLRNGKKQLVFTTKNALHVWDRNGKPVAPFPIQFKDDITQPLSVFDYDNNRNYRFAIVQGKEVLLYNAKGKVVNGFTFRKAASPIVLPVQHIRMGNKDYVLLALENGTLHILSRTGKTRVSVSETFAFSELPITGENGHFVVWEENNTLSKIATSGSVESTKENVSAGYSRQTAGTTLITLNDNLLRIDQQLIELPFGIYTQPVTLNTRNGLYICVTETQENKVYLYNREGVLQRGFPVYGSGPFDLEYHQGQLLLTGQGGAKTLMRYELK